MTRGLNIGLPTLNCPSRESAAFVDELRRYTRDKLRLLIALARDGCDKFGSHDVELLLVLVTRCRLGFSSLRSLSDTWVLLVSISRI